jgi:hypothetical protein
MAQKFYQIVSRKNDVNGNPSRLIFVYLAPSELWEVVEVGTSQTSNYQVTLDHAGYVQIGSFHLAPAEYNAHKKRAKERNMLFFRD